ncbi:MAG: enoyl-CoA hydratase/isomerase family protein [Gammaproteobacteria bacterium]|nr:enoyl-CoA hydratase/isomerase family protein [Gammaproteobacteria bacterium]
MDTSVLLTEHETPAGVLGQAQLNAQATLNALSLEMIRTLTTALANWAGRDEVAGVLITAAGDKAFCAGGDIQALYHAMCVNHQAGEVVNDYPYRFFEEEYRLDYALHTFAKPLVCLGHGLVMGGGLGVFSSSKYRILTDRSRLAMPEITIGLFPDAGASWALSNMPSHYASFLALTGSHINAHDGLLSRLGTHVISHLQREEFVSQCLTLPWQCDIDRDHQMVLDWLSEITSPELPASGLVDIPPRTVHTENLQAEVAEIYALAGRSDWIDRGIGNLRKGCPTTAGIVLEQLRRVPSMSLAESFRMELTLATHCIQNPDFREGVRALLIDKGSAPRWQWGSIEELNWDYVLGHFEQPWPKHPLADL